MFQCENGRHRTTTTPTSHVTQFEIPSGSFTFEDVNQASMNVLG